MTESMFRQRAAVIHERHAAAPMPPAPSPVRPGDLLRAYRARRGWNRSQASVRCGVSTASLLAYESGEYAPSLSTVLGIADGYRLGAVEQDALLVAAGYGPIGQTVVVHRRDEPVLCALCDLLTGDTLGPPERDRLRQELARVVETMRP